MVQDVGYNGKKSIITYTENQNKTPTDNKTTNIPPTYHLVNTHQTPSTSNNGTNGNTHQTPSASNNGINGDTKIEVQNHEVSLPNKTAASGEVDLMSFPTTKTTNNVVVGAKCANIANLLSQPSKNPKIEANTHDFNPRNESPPYYEINIHQLNLEGFSIENIGPITDIDDIQSQFQTEDIGTPITANDPFSRMGREGLEDIYGIKVDV